jgi:two-component system LytT family response regulator
VIFVTAYDRYALDAFEVHALDYLLKPVAAERMKAALNQVRAARELQIMNADFHRRVAIMLTALESRPDPKERLLVKADGEITFLAAEEIDWIEAAGNYVTLHMNHKTKLLRETLSAMKKRLGPNRFVRISRSVIVNTAKIKTMRSAHYGDYRVQLLDATELTLSRGYRESFFARINLP